MKNKLEKLSKENLQNIILKMRGFLSEEQCLKLERMIDAFEVGGEVSKEIQAVKRMSDELVNEKMKQLEEWMRQIEEGELYLNIDAYEDYSSGYWDRDWIIDYYDNQGIGDKISFAIQFAKDCVDDRRYQEANHIYEWLWDMAVGTDEEYDGESVDLETLVEKNIVHTDMKQLALLTLYTDYQALKPEMRAENIYLYFLFGAFRNIHIEEMFYVGRENLTGTEQFWEDWIALLQTKNGEVAARLLKEAVLYHEGVEGLEKMAEKNSSVHPSLYLTVLNEYEKKHDYQRIEKIGERALAKIDSNFVIRSEVALKAAHASSCLMHTDKVMQFCWESFRSDSTDRNLLRLFGTDEMSRQYGLRGHEVLASRLKGNPTGDIRNAELRQNIMGDYGYYKLCFYTGDFQKVKMASKNPQSSLGWSESFIRYGIRLFLLYLYESPLPSKAARCIAGYVGFPDETDVNCVMSFESEIIEESRKYKISIFWNYFQRWKQYFQMTPEEKKQYFAWAEKIVYDRTDAIVKGQYRNHYGEVAALLAVVAEIKENMGVAGAKQGIFAEYKRKFPRHSSFQAEMKNYFDA